jgi:hypothetical protein
MPLGTSSSAMAKNQSRVTVINERLIRECIYLAPQVSSEDDRSKNRNDRNEKQDRLKQLAQQMDLAGVQCIMFSYKHLARIDNLFGVDNVTKLHLDNNNITKIENLGHLKHLKWLDLSFNQIKEMEGLDSLTHLEDLSLFSNQITEIKGIESLSNLQCLSLGKNEIENLEKTAEYLHKLYQSLRMLTLQGNKVETQAHYRTRMLAYLPNLKFLDNRLILADDIAKAREEQRENLVPIDEKDAQREAEARRDAEEHQTVADYKRYNCPNEAKFFEELYRLQPEGKPVVAMLELEDVAERIKDIFDRYREDFNAKAKELSDTMRGIRVKRDADDKSFRDTVEDYKMRNSDQCKGYIKQFERELKKTIPFGLKAKPDPDAYDEEAIKSLKDELAQLSTILLELEADQYDALSSVIQQAVEKYKNDEVGTIFNNFFGSEQLQKIEQDFQILLKQKLDSLYEERQKQSDSSDSIYHSNQSDINKAALAMLENKDEYQKALAEWNELHRKKLEELEQFYIKNEESLIRTRKETILREEHQRNRSRVGEIHSYVQRMNDVILQWEQAYD